MLVDDKDIMKVNKELRRLKAENIEMKEQLQNYIPRRRVRRIFKSLKSILEMDIQDDNKLYLDQLKDFIQKIEKEGPQVADNTIKTAIEHIIGDYELKDPEDGLDDLATSISKTLNYPDILFKDPLKEDIAQAIMKKQQNDTQTLGN